MIIKTTPQELSSLTNYKVLAQNTGTYECIVEVKTLPEGYTELTEIPDGFYQRCLPPSYGKILTLEQINNGRREQKIKEISDAFNEDLNQGVETSVLDSEGNPIKMNAHYEDVTKLDGAVRLALKLGLTTVDIGDYNDKTQTGITVEDADAISIDMATNYSTKLGKKWQLREQAKTVAIEELDTITW